MKIQYSPNVDKIIEAILLIAEELAPADFHSILKTLFYADKYHLQKYGRPVIGDAYTKMAFGPVPSCAYDILKGEDSLPPDILEKSFHAFSTERKNKIPYVIPRRKFNKDFFSESDIECLKEATDKCRQTSFAERTQMTHAEPAWINAEMNHIMDYELFIDEDIPNRSNLLEYIRDTASPQLAL